MWSCTARRQSTCGAITTLPQSIQVLEWSYGLEVNVERKHLEAYFGLRSVGLQLLLPGESN